MRVKSWLKQGQSRKWVPVNLPRRIRKWRLRKKQLRSIAALFGDKDYRRWLVRQWMKEQKQAFAIRQGWRATAKAREETEK